MHSLGAPALAGIRRPTFSFPYLVMEGSYVNKPRLLLLRSDRLGDCMLALPAAATLRSLVPDAHIAFCCRPENLPLVSLVQGIDEVIPWDPATGAASLRDKLQAFDGAAMLLPKPPSLAWALWRSGVNIRVGSARRWWSFLFSNRVAGSRSSGLLHESQQNTRLAIALAQAVGATEAPQSIDQLLPTFDFPEAVMNQAHNLIAASGLSGEGPLVILHGGSRGSAKDWPLKESTRRLLFPRFYCRAPTLSAIKRTHTIMR
jgi:ADP-heptose:LPS heptosyltransferase